VLRISAASRNGLTILNKDRVLPSAAAGKGRSCWVQGPGTSRQKQPLCLLPLTVRWACACWLPRKARAPSRHWSPRAGTVTLLHACKQRSCPLALQTHACFFLPGLHCACSTFVYQHFIWQAQACKGLSLPGVILSTYILGCIRRSAASRSGRFSSPSALP